MNKCFLIIFILYLFLCVIIYLTYFTSINIFFLNVKHVKYIFISDVTAGRNILYTRYILLSLQFLSKDNRRLHHNGKTHFVTFYGSC